MGLVAELKLLTESTDWRLVCAKIVQVNKHTKATERVWVTIIELQTQLLVAITIISCYCIQLNGKHPNFVAEQLNATHNGETPDLTSNCDQFARANIDPTY